MTKYFLSFLLLFLFGYVGAVTTDSLLQELENSTGKKKVILLNELYKKYVNNDPVKAFEYTTEALNLAESLQDSSGMGSSYNNLGVIYKNKGNLDKALEHYFEALRIQEDNKFVDALAYTYSNIGTVYSLKADYQKALEYFNKANDQFKSINHNLRVIGALNNIGNVYSAIGNDEKALEYYLESLKLYEELEDNSSAFVPFNNIGNIYFNQGDYDRALAYYESSLDLEKFNNDRIGEANALHNIGLVQKARGEFDEAIETFNEALAIAQENGNTRLLEIIYESLAESYFAKNDMFMAYSFLRLHTVAKDSLYSEESNQRIRELENVYELEKKENEIEALKLQSDLQQLQIKNDRTILTAVVVISLLGVILTVIIFKEYQQIRKNKRLLEETNTILKDQKQIIEEKNNDITESIDYAKSVQQSLLRFQVHEDKIKKSLTIFRPKDIVSGDFYWYADKGDIDIVVVADCTGHGVAGAFMTILGVSSLENVINKDGITSPAKILENTDQLFSNSIKQSHKDISDYSIDMVVCHVDYKNQTVTMAGANRSLFHFGNGVLNEVKGTKRSIGGGLTQNDEGFVEHKIDYNSGDAFYMTTDGFTDQFGGPDNKKFMVKRFKNLLIEIQSLDIQDQKLKLKETLDNWQGDNEQTDDILVLGFKL